MSTIDIIILIITILLVSGLLFYLIFTRAKNPCHGCHYSKKMSKNKLLKQYRKKYKKDNSCCCKD